MSILIGVHASLIMAIHIGGDHMTIVYVVKMWCWAQDQAELG